jgi:hypothetical protein
MNDLHFEVIVKDETFRKLGTWKFQKKEAGKYFRILSSQFDLGIKVKYQDRDSDDLNWLK